MQSYFKFKLGFIIILIFNVLLIIKFHLKHLNETHSNVFINKLTVKKHSKWIVVTSINEPTKQIARLANQTEFKLIVIADLKTNPKWTHPNVTFVSVGQQNILNLKSIKKTPFNSYTRKNIGYLIAIQLGAQFIYDTDDDNEPTIDIGKYYNYNQFRYELEYDSRQVEVLNPFAHFGQPMIWPRGYPLNAIKNEIHNDYFVAFKKTSIIQQGVVNGDPDVDAIFRLTKSNKIKNLNIEFDETAPSVKIPIYQLTPFNSQNTLFHYESFWALYLPHSVSFRLTDIWRSYWAQRLMWLLNGTLSYHGPNVHQLRNVHSYLKDLHQEQDMYFKTQNLIQFIYKWKCKSKRFYSCVLDLSEQMAANRFWNQSEIPSIKNWLADLNSVGYTEPTIINFAYELSNLTISDFFQNMTFIKKQQDHVRFTPIFKPIVEMDNYYGDAAAKMSSLDRLDTLEFFGNYCLRAHKLTFNLTSLKKKPQQQRKLTLLITFNHAAIFDNIIFLKHFYQDYFKHVVFCGLNLWNLTTYKHFKKFDSFTFIEYNTNWGYFHYFCMSKLIDMGFRTEGILLMSDDVLLKYWNLKALNEKKLWFFTNLTCEYELNSNKTVGIWMATPEGRPALKKSFNRIDQLLNDSETDFKVKKIFKSFVNTLIENSVNKTVNSINFCWKGSDVFYLPRDFFFKFNLVTKLFRNEKVFLEFAVPTILSGLNERSKLAEILQGKYYWTSYYDFNDYSKTVHFAHPMKLTHYLDLILRKQMCSTYVQQRLDES